MLSPLTSRRFVLMVPDSVSNSPCLTRARLLLPLSPLTSVPVPLSDLRKVSPELLNDLVPLLDPPRSALLPDRAEPDALLEALLLSRDRRPPLTAPRSLPRELAVSLNAPEMRPSRATAVLVP